MSDDKQADEGEQDFMLKTPVLMSVIGAQCALFTAIGLGLWVWAGEATSEFVSVDMRQIGIGLAIAAGMIAAGYVMFRAFPRFGEKLVRDQVPQFPFLENKLGWLPILFISACAGIGEEALFRGGMLTFASDYVPVWVALIATSVLFALVHLAKPVVATLIAAIGLIFGVAYLATGSLLAVMIGHAVYDVWALWFIQEEMHRLRVFDEPLTEPDNTAEQAASAV